MFSHVFRRNRDTQVTDYSSPVEPMVQATSNESTDTQLGGGKQKNENSNDLMD